MELNNAELIIAELTFADEGVIKKRVLRIQCPEDILRHWFLRVRNKKRSFSCFTYYKYFLSKN